MSVYHIQTHLALNAISQQGISHWLLDIRISFVSHNACLPASVQPPPLNGLRSEATGKIPPISPSPPQAPLRAPHPRLVTPGSRPPSHEGQAEWWRPQVIATSSLNDNRSRNGCVCGDHLGLNAARNFRDSSCDESEFQFVLNRKDKVVGNCITRPSTFAECEGRPIRGINRSGFGAH